tara:strand:+ start:18147 stop:19403 length:1257 start_codon:yes stop_codon:yes gene_type:complete
MNSSKKNLAEQYRKDFPLFSSSRKGENSIIYLDHAATSQKPFQVIEALKEYYSYSNANVHRGAHQLSAKATEAFENSRRTIADFIKAKSSNEIVFTRNATESLNLIANSWGRMALNPGDEILLTIMEHHSNLVPWQIIAKQKDCQIRHVGINDNGELDMNDLKAKINNRTRIISVVHTSNTLGCCNSINEITKLAHNAGALVCLDACQSLAHQPINVHSLDIDFLAGSSHKLCGPTGVGFLWAKEEILEKMPPFLGGGEMIEEVFLDHSTWAELPHKFEAGTPAIGEAIGLGAALNYLQDIGLEEIKAYEKELTEYLFQKLNEVEDIIILGPKPCKDTNRGALATFYLKNIHSNDIAELLDSKGICIRSGHHCCQPLHRHIKVNSTARVSLSFTSTKEEIDAFIQELVSIISFIKDNS